MATFVSAVTAFDAESKARRREGKRPVKPIERTLEDCFERASNSRFAYGDREAAALRADLDFAVRSKGCSAMRTMGQCRSKPSQLPGVIA